MIQDKQINENRISLFCTFNWDILELRTHVNDNMVTQQGTKRPFLRLDQNIISKKMNQKFPQSNGNHNNWFARITRKFKN